MPSQTQISRTPSQARDLWQSPPEFVHYAKHILQYDFTIDLAASSKNKVADAYFSEKQNSLRRVWHKSHETGWCNPPYSNTGLWLKKGYEESLQGFKSVFFVPTPNGESYYGDYVFGKAARIVYVTGRVAFIAAETFWQVNKDGTRKLIKKGQRVNGNTRGSCYIIYDEEYRQQHGQACFTPDNISKQEIMKIYQAHQLLEKVA